MNHVYVKLVNADSVDKVTKIDLEELHVADKATMIVLTGDSSLVHIPNVNKKNDEQVKPVETEIRLASNSTTVTLAAHSVNILVLDLI
ncbi:hypothetical protein D3C76_1165960 [compost metagenome]